MSEPTIRTFSADEVRRMIADGGGRTDWAALDAKTEADLDADMAGDPDWAGVPRDWMQGPDMLVVREGQIPPIAVDPVVTDWFRRQGTITRRASTMCCGRMSASIRRAEGRADF